MEKNICIVSSADITMPLGGAIRILSMAKGLQENGFKVHIIAPKPSRNNFPLNIENIEVDYISIGWGASVLNQILRFVFLVLKAKKMNSRDIIFQMETSPLGGVASYFGFTNFVLVVHDLAFAKFKHSKSSWSQKIYSKIIYNLECRAVKNAREIVTVSNNIKQFIETEWDIPEERIEVIYNGYFESKINALAEIKEEKGTITFVGLLADFINIDKIINCILSLKNEKVKFYIVGDGPQGIKIRDAIKVNNLDNVIITGFIPIDKVYEYVAKSEVVLFPFNKSFHTEMSCPIKLIEYIGLGKAMVVDEVTEIATILKNNNAALIANPENEHEFIEHVRTLIENEDIRKKISNNTRKISKQFSWENGAEQLVDLYRKMNL